LDTEGQEVPETYKEYGTGTWRSQETSSKTEKFFVWEISKINLGFVWDRQA